METLTNSRFITWPSVVERTASHTVVLVDPTQDDIDNISKFCSACDKNYDIYIYDGDSGDLEYLNAISNNSDLLIINNISQISTSTNSVRYGLGQGCANAVDYFIKFDRID